MKGEVDRPSLSSASIIQQARSHPRRRESLSSPAERSPLRRICRSRSKLRDSFCCGCLVQVRCILDDADPTMLCKAPRTEMRSVSVGTAKSVDVTLCKLMTSFCDNCKSIRSRRCSAVPYSHETNLARRIVEITFQSWSCTLDGSRGELSHFRQTGQTGHVRYIIMSLDSCTAA